MMLTAVGRQKETAIPCIARNMISWIPDLAKPQAKTNTPWKKQPIRNIVRLQTRSATEPERMRKHPVVRLHLFSVPST